ncbi:MAG: 4Fe-4S ferredoxin [Gemmatimonas sp.]|nr:4Fe-4S ferredoxin [Gemmatimonas sp.]
MNDATGTRDGLDDATRREFLKRLAVAGAAASFGAIGLILPESAGALATSDYDWTRHRWVYLIDTRKCIGCGACVRACRVENDVPDGMYRTWVERYHIPAGGEAAVDSPDGGAGGFLPVAGAAEPGKAFFVPKICNHCEQTPCTQVCPVGASYSTRDGVVLVDAERCIGCGYCVQACPYGSRYLDPRTHTAEKCTWCYHRLVKGRSTACVGICPTAARMIGDRENPDDPINEILATQRILVLQPELLTKPQCFYLGLDMEVR